MDLIEGNRLAREDWERRVAHMYAHAQIQEDNNGIRAVTPSGHVVGYYDRYTNSYVVHDNQV